MKRSKRILALLLSMVLLLGMLPISALAAENEGEEELKRYTVLVLDTSSTATFLHDGEPIYTADTAIEYVKKAAMKFISSLVNADGTNYVAVVSFKATASVVSGFTDDTQALNKKVGELTAADNIRDISAGLEAADALISTVPDGEHVRKNVVLFTTGMTNNGDYSYSGRYDENTVGSNWRRTDTNIRLYAYANHAISVAEALKQKATLYTIGLFQTMEGMPEQGKDIVEFFKLTAKDLATSTDYYYPVDDPDDLEFTFGDVAGDIVNEKKIITSKFKWSGEAKKGGDQESICYYSDDYFMESSTIMNSHLRTMSIAFVLSSFASEDSDTTWEQKSNSEKDEEAKKTEDIVFSKTAKWRNARDLLCGKENDKDYPGLGFGDETFRVNDFWMSKPTRDSIGVLAANKTLRDGSTLVALAIRGGGYEQEWSSNLTVGLWDEHEGFAKAKRDTLDFLDANGIVPASCELRTLSGGEEDVGDFGVTMFPTSHDVPCVGYRIHTPDNKTMTIATDLGVLTPPVHQALSGCDLVALESNYDLHMLRSGRYPYYLRSRIESNRGHLSNDECSAKLLELIQEGCKKFALCHLSQENNTPALALQTMFNTLGAAGVVPEKDCIVQAQRRNEISPTLTF